MCRCLGGDSNKMEPGILGNMITTILHVLQIRSSAVQLLVRFTISGWWMGCQLQASILQCLVLLPPGLQHCYGNMELSIQYPGDIQSPCSYLYLDT